MIGLDGWGWEEMHPGTVLHTGLVYMASPGFAMVSAHSLCAIYLSFNTDGELELDNNRTRNLKFPR